MNNVFLLLKLEGMQKCGFQLTPGIDPIFAARLNKMKERVAECNLGSHTIIALR